MKGSSLTQVPQHCLSSGLPTSIPPLNYFHEISSPQFPSKCFNKEKIHSGYCGITNLTPTKAGVQTKKLTPLPPRSSFSLFKKKIKIKNPFFFFLSLVEESKQTKKNNKQILQGCN